MERERDRVPSADTKKADLEDVNVIEWEDFGPELARLCSLSSALKEAEEKKQSLQQKLESLINVKAESLSWSNELEEMRQKLEARKLVMRNMSMHGKIAGEEVKKQENSLSVKVKSLLVAGTALSIARKQLQESNVLLAGERGFGRLRTVQRRLRVRQQYMIAQVSLLYPVKILVGPAQEQELESFPGVNRVGYSSGSKPVNQGSLAILGLHLSMLPFTKMSFFTDKKEVQRSATALGYVAHAVLLISSYLKVPLRYPLRLGGSRSHINDYASSLETMSSDLFSNQTPSGNVKLVEFPLFLEGQETTKAAYAVFLLNKDLEQLVNFIGVKSLGPRQVLANLRELIRTILSPEYIDT